MTSSMYRNIVMTLGHYNNYNYSFLILLYIYIVLCIEDLFQKYNCGCAEVEVTDFRAYSDDSYSVIPDAVKKVHLHMTLC